MWKDDVLIRDSKFFFPFIGSVCRSEFIFKSILINNFKQSMPQGSVNFNPGSNNELSFASDWEIGNPCLRGKRISDELSTLD